MFSEDFESFVTNLIFLLQLRVVSDSGKLLLRRRRRQHWGCDYKDLGCSVPVEVHERACTHERTETHTHTLFSLTCTDTCAHAQQTHLQASMHTLTQYLSFLSHLHWHNIESMRHTHTICHSLSLSVSLMKAPYFFLSLVSKGRSQPPTDTLAQALSQVGFNHYSLSTLHSISTHYLLRHTHTLYVSHSLALPLSLWLFFKTLK